MAEGVPRETDPLDAFERAVVFALERALQRDRERARRRTMTVVVGGKRGGRTA